MVKTEAVMEDMTLQLNGIIHESSTIDGVRVRFTEDGEQQGWYLARKSNTEPILVMRVEAVNEEKLTQMLSLIDSRVSSIINIEKLLE